MMNVIKRETLVPTFSEEIYNNTCDNLTEMLIHIYEGEKKYVKYNHLL